MINKSLKDKVLYCLEKYPKAREDDTKLCNAVWVEYYSTYTKKDEEGNYYIRLIDLYKVPMQDDIIRHRRHIQNKECKFQPPLTIMKQRLEAESIARAELGYPSAGLHHTEKEQVMNAFEEYDKKQTNLFNK